MAKSEVEERVWKRLAIEVKLIKQQLDEHGGHPCSCLGCVYQKGGGCPENKRGDKVCMEMGEFDWIWVISHDQGKVKDYGKK